MITTGFPVRGWHPRGLPKTNSRPGGRPANSTPWPSTGIPTQRIYADKNIGATLDRAGLAEMLRYARDGDTIVATNLDRLRRNLRECLNVLHDLRQQGLGIKILKDPLPIATTDNSPLPELAVALLALFAHLQRVFLHQRTAHPRDTAATHDKQPGRPPQTQPPPTRRHPRGTGCQPIRRARSRRIRRLPRHPLPPPHRAQQPANSPPTSTNPLICGW